MIRDIIPRRSVSSNTNRSNFNNSCLAFVRVEICKGESSGDCSASGMSSHSSLSGDHKEGGAADRPVGYTYPGLEPRYLLRQGDQRSTLCGQPKPFEKWRSFITEPNLRGMPL